MRLINTATLELEQFMADAIPLYAVLSHTWGKDELTLQEYDSSNGRSKLGFQKIKYTCDQAREHGIPYAWVDTCCIDKTSSAELSEAISSMWDWYQNAEICYAYLQDVSIAGIAELNEQKDIESAKRNSTANWTSLPTSRWTSRGWTLQELLAPREVEFYSTEWCLFGTRASLAPELALHTQIDIDILQGHESFSNASVAKRMSWASHRKTTRIEDQAYCLLGLFDVNMPLLYGEGEKAFVRLQEEILRVTDDESIFAWKDPTAGPDAAYGLLARSAAMFDDSAQFVHYRDWSKPPVPISFSSLGVALPALLEKREPTFRAYIHCRNAQNGKNLGLHLRAISEDARQFVRIQANTLAESFQLPQSDLMNIYVRQRLIQPSPHDIFRFEVWTCAGAFLRGMEGGGPGATPSYRLIARVDSKGASSPHNTPPSIMLSGAPSQLSFIYVIASASSGIFFILIGSGPFVNNQDTAQKPAFTVKHARELGFRTEMSWHDAQVYFSKSMSIAGAGAAYSPDYDFGETMIFDSKHRIKLYVREGPESYSNRAFYLEVSPYQSKLMDRASSEQHLLELKPPGLAHISAQTGSSDDTSSQTKRSFLKRLLK